MKLFQKTICALYGDIMTPNVHYDPDNISAYAADKKSSGFIFAYANQNNNPIRRFDLFSYYTHES